MIQSFKHKGLEKFFTDNSKKGIQPAHATKIQAILSTLEAAAEVNEMNMSGWVLHLLHPPSAQVWSVKVNGNWRITFRFTLGHAYEVDYLDYH